MRITHDKARSRWNATNEYGRVIGYVYLDGDCYACVVNGERTEHRDSADALLALSLRTDEKESA